MHNFCCFCVYRVPGSSLSSKFQMTLDKIELRVLIRYCWKRRLSTRDAAKEICDAEGEGTVHYTTVSRWYKRFDSGDLSLEDQPRSGRPSTLDNEDLRTALEDEPSSSSRELASVLGVSSHQTVLNHLHQMDFVHKKPRQDPHELTEAQAKRRVEVCRQLLENPLDDRFWKRIVTSDEKWVYLVNHNRQKQWVPRGQDPPSVPRHKIVSARR
jgi:transposase